MNKEAGIKATTIFLRQAPPYSKDLWICMYIMARAWVTTPTFSTTAESIAKTNENVARQNANEEKRSCFFLSVSCRQ